MGILIKLVPILIFHSIYIWNGVESQECIPYELDAPWCTLGVKKGEFTCLKKGVISVEQKISKILGAKNGTFTVYCDAKYPIDFDMTVTNSQENLMTSFKSSRTKSDMDGSLITTYEIFISLVNLLAPRHIMVYEIGNKARNTSFFLLRPGEIAFPNKEDKVVMKSESEILAIPCIVSESNLKVIHENLQLRKIVNENVSEVYEMATEKPTNGRKSIQVKRKKIFSTRIENEYSIDNMSLSYDITKGILLNTPYFEEPYGEFSCVYKTSNIDAITKKEKKERFSVKILPPQDLVIEPNTNELYYFQKGRIQLSCKSADDIVLKGFFNGNEVLVHSSRNEFSHLKYQTKFTYEDTEIGEKGTISCYSKNNPTRILHSWNISTLDIWNNTKLSLKIADSKIYCGSTDMKPRLSLISCSGETNCRHRVDCLLHGEKCANIHFGNECGSNKACLAFEEQFSQGLIGCTAGEIKYWTYFVKGFDNEIYTDWRTAPPEALIEINIPNERLYSHGWFIFTCRVSTFLSNGEILWKYRKADSSDLYSFNRKNSKIVSRANSWIKDKLKLHSDMTHITCSVPQWDSDVLWNVSTRINMEATEIPIIKSKGQNAIFVRNQTDRSIGCVAAGLPQPKIMWLRNGQKLPSTFQEIETNDEDNRKVLKFPQITEEHAGDYVCLATNKVGNVTENFTVVVKDPKAPTFSIKTVEHPFYMEDVDQYLLLECKVEGLPRPTIKWTLPKNSPAKHPSKSEYNLFTVSTIKLLKSKEIEGTYICNATNAYGSTTQRHVVKGKDRTSQERMIIVGASVAILALFIPLIFVIFRLRLAKRRIRDLTKAEIYEFFNGVSSDKANKSQTNTYIKDPLEEHVNFLTSMPYKREFEISKNRLIIDEDTLLGEGEYGRVQRASITGMPNTVAVKTMKPDKDVSFFKALLSELKIMTCVGEHPNVVSLIGACTENIKTRELFIVVELCQHGSLEKYLRNIRKDFVDQLLNYEIVSVSRNIEKDPTILLRKDILNSSEIKTFDLIRWSYQIAHGMDFLASKKVIHADLSTRNVLLHEDGTIRITDFGLSRQLCNYEQYVKKNQEPLPWRWMAIESLNIMSFSSKSDVWAFGVTMWELFSLADIPYPGKTWTVDFVDELVHGLRLNKPRHASTELYAIMLECWKECPENRPDFSKLMNAIYQAVI